MEYTIQKLAEMAGVSTRALRYYDEIGLLHPNRISSSGYRIYSRREVERLQQIMFYRELSLPLDTIQELLDAPGFDSLAALKGHREQLLGQKQRLDLLIQNVERSIAAAEGSMTMRDVDKFEGFKRQQVEENERKYGEELRTKYGEETVSRANHKLQGMSPEQYEAVTALEQQLKATLATAIQSGDPAGEQAQQAAELHKRWLCFYWDSYSKEAHAGLAQMYVDDERFTAYYDQEQPGTAAFLRDAILVYTGQ
ncbi:transcriptional regulator [Paenibacillus algicola]|uniref:Transcriptional regulator n=1 Tax=Paenibacillus algicola TaxID=2565926 RepID=A0A4P8XIK3_9BACL|nr:MerR family transcriptional regulator [Paenibacillus algicola]QCT01320.1 transcriptional regulator [Paenibacillus algicola]